MSLNDRFNEPYFLQHGDLWKRPSGNTVAPQFRQDAHIASGSEEIGVCYDRRDGSLHHIGSAASASAWLKSRSEKLRNAGFEEMAGDLVSVSFPMVEQTVAEINACLAISGRVLKLPERLAEIAAEVGDVPRYPTFG